MIKKTIVLSTVLALSACSSKTQVASTSCFSELNKAIQNSEILELNATHISHKNSEAHRLAAFSMELQAELENTQNSSLKGMISYKDDVSHKFNDSYFFPEVNENTGRLIELNELPKGTFEPSRIRLTYTPDQHRLGEVISVNTEVNCQNGSQDILVSTTEGYPSGAKTSNKSSYLNERVSESIPFNIVVNDGKVAFLDMHDLSINVLSNDYSYFRFYKSDYAEKTSTEEDQEKIEEFYNSGESRAELEKIMHSGVFKHEEYFRIQSKQNNVDELWFSYYNSSAKENGIPLYSTGRVRAEGGFPLGKDFMIVQNEKNSFSIYVSHTNVSFGYYVRIDYVRSNENVKISEADVVRDTSEVKNLQEIQY